VDKWVPGIKLIGVGFYICACIIGSTLAGMWLDSKFGTKPIFILIGLILGLVFAFWGVYQLLIPIIRDNNKNKERR
jgi:ATP synthase protein I